MQENSEKGTENMNYLIYGAGNNLGSLIRKMRGIYNIDYILDGDVGKQNTTVMGIPIVAPSYLESEEYQGQRIIISVTNENALTEIESYLRRIDLIEGKNFFKVSKLFSLNSAMPGHVSGHLELPGQLESIKSFDSASRLIVKKDEKRIIRAVNSTAAKQYKSVYDICADNGLFDDCIVKTSVVENEWKLPYALLLEHEYIEPVSYCFEWAPNMYKEYVKFMLHTFESLSKVGLGLDDGHALNATISGGKFVFLDFGAIKQGVTLARTLLEFLNTHIIPLVLLEKGQVDKAYMFMKHMGIEFTKVDIEGYLTLKEREMINGLYDLAISVCEQSEISSFVNAVSEFISVLESTKLATIWEGYQNDEWEWSGDKSKWSAKMLNVMHMMEKVNPSTVIDLAGNMGWYGSYLHKQMEHAVIVDMDYNCIDYLWKKVQSESMENVIPIYMSLCAPTLDYYRDDMIGKSGIVPWRNNAMTRFKSEMVIALAIVHHLAFSQQLTFDEIIVQMDAFSTKYLIIEFIEQTDRYITNFLKNGFEWYTQENFEMALKKKYEIMEVMASTPGETRTVYLCKKLECHEMKQRR